MTTITWEYDGLNRLVSETSGSTNDDRDYVDAFTYDLASNRLSEIHMTLSETTNTVYFYDANDLLLSEIKDSTNDTSGGGKIASLDILTEIQNKLAKQYIKARTTQAYSPAA